MTLLTAILVGVLTGLRVNDRRRRLWITGAAVRKGRDERGHALCGPSATAGLLATATS